MPTLGVPHRTLTQLIIDDHSANQHDPSNVTANSKRSFILPEVATFICDDA